MFESRRLTSELDAIVGVREAETGYRDRWRNWLARENECEERMVCRLLKTMGLLGG